MISCVQCHREMRDNEYHLVNADGDMVCSEFCKKQYELDREAFFRDVSGDSAAFQRWMKNESPYGES